MHRIDTYVNTIAVESNCQFDFNVQMEFGITTIPCRILLLVKFQFFKRFEEYYPIDNPCLSVCVK